MSERFECFLHLEVKKVGGVSPILKLKFHEFRFCKLYWQVFIMDKSFEKSYKH